MIMGIVGKMYTVPLAVGKVIDWGTAVLDLVRT